MKKLASVSLLAMALLLVVAIPSQGRGRGGGHFHGGGRFHGGGVRPHVFIGVGPGWWGPPYYPDVSTCPEPWVKVAPRSED